MTPITRSEELGKLKGRLIELAEGVHGGRIDREDARRELARYKLRLAELLRQPQNNRDNHATTRGQGYE